MGIAQLGYAGGYVVPDVGSAALNAVAAVGCLAIGGSLIRRAASSSLYISIACAGTVVVAGGYQLTQGIGGALLVAGLAAAGVAGFMSAFALGRLGGLRVRVAVHGTATTSDTPLMHVQALPSGDSAAVVASVSNATMGRPSPGDSLWRRVRALVGSARIVGLPLAWTIVALVLTSGVAALIADRFSGPGGPWLWSYDMPHLDFPFASFMHDAVSNGSLPFWNDQMGMGYPLYAEGQIGAFYPPNWLIYQLPPLLALDVARIAHLTIAGVGAGLIVVKLSGSRTGAMTAAAVAVLCGAIVAKLEWTNLVVAYGWMPWVLLPVVRVRPGTAGRAAATAALTWGVQALAGHPPTWVLTGIAAGALLLAHAPNRRGLMRVAFFGVVGAGVGAVQLVPTAILVTYSIRANSLISADLFQFSATPFDFLGVAFANAFVPAGEPSWPLLQSWYPGGTFALLESYAFVGLPALALAVIGLGLRRARGLLLLAAVTIAIPVLGAFQPALWTMIPVLNGLRHPVRAYVVLDLVLAIAAGLGVARIGRVGVRLPALIVALAIAGYSVLTVFAVAAPNAFDDLVGTLWPFPPPGHEEELRALVVGALTSPWPLSLELALGGLMLVVVRFRSRLPLVRAVAAALAVMPLAVLVPGVNQVLGESAFNWSESPLVVALQRIAPHQVLSANETSLGVANQLALAGIPDLRVFSALPLQATSDLLESARASPGGSLVRAVGVDTVIAFGAPCPAGNEVAYISDSDVHVCTLPGALVPPYWLPASVITLPARASRGPESPADAQGDASEALNRAVPAVALARDAGSAQVEVDAPGAGFVFIDRAWYPIWQITVDGQPVTPLRLWGGQLVPVAFGRHMIGERLVPWDAQLGLVVSLGAVVAVVLILSGWRFRLPSGPRPSGARPSPRKPEPKD